MQTSETSNSRSGITLRALMNRARDAGHPRLPTFVAVHLLQRLSATMDVATVLPEGRLSVDSVSYRFDGTFQVTGSAGAAEDTRALAGLFEAIGGIPPDDLSPILATALRGEISSPRLFAQKLGHWAVKQRQLPGGMDLGVALLAWLFPNEAPQPPPLELAEYFAAERTTAPVVIAAPREVVEPTNEPPSKVGIAIAGLVAVAVVAAMITWSTMQDEVAEPPPLVIDAPKPLPKRVDKPVDLPSARAPEETLSRFGHGVPASIVLSQSVHGIDLSRAGVLVKAPSPKWSARTTFARDSKLIPSYAWLYAAEFDASGKLLKITTVSPAWTALEGATARFFTMQPDMQPDEGSFDLALATGVNAKRKLGDRVPKVLGEALTQQEGRRFILDELTPGDTYVITLQKGAPPVIVTATQPRAFMYSRKAFHEKGPLQQQLLTPGVPQKVSGVSRLSFVMLGVGASTEQYTVSMQAQRDLVKAGSEDAMTHFKAGEAAIMRGDYVTAINEFTRCTAIDPKVSMCSDLLAQSRRMFELQMK